MRIAALVGAVLVANLITVGGIVALVLLSHGRAEDVTWLAVVALMAVVYGPLLLGSLRSYWNVHASSDSWRYFRWWFGALYALQVLGLIAIVVYAVLSPTSPLLPVGYAVLAVGLDVLAHVVGNALLRRDEARRPAEPAWEPVTRQQIARKILAVAITFVALLAIGSIGLTVLFESTKGGRADTVATGLLFAGEFAFIGAAFACIIVSLQFNRQLRENVSRDVAVLRRIAKVVLRRKPIELDDDEQVAAAKYSVLIGVSLPFTFSYIVLLYIGIGMQQISTLQRQGSDGFSVAFLILFAAILVVGLPLYIVRIRRAWAYSRAHRDLLPAASDAATGSA